MLTSVVRSRDITIKTKSNEDVNEDKQFYIVVQPTSDNSPLVKLQSANLTLIIEDDDIICEYIIFYTHLESSYIIHLNICTPV